MRFNDRTRMRAHVRSGLCHWLAGPFLGQPVFHVIFAPCLTRGPVSNLLSCTRPERCNPDRRYAAGRSIDNHDDAVTIFFFSSRSPPRSNCLLCLSASLSLPGFPFESPSLVYVIQGFCRNDEITEICMNVGICIRLRPLSVSCALI